MVIVLLKKWVKVAAAIAVCCCAALIIALPSAAADGARSGLLLCGQIVIPSLFPLTVIAGFILSAGIADLFSRPFGALLGRVLRLPDSACTALVLSFLSGYPVGGTMVKRLHLSGSIDGQTARRMLCYTVNAGPAMIILVVGQGLFGSKAAGWLLYAVHVAASLIIGAVTAIGKPRAAAQSGSKVVRLNLAAAFVSSVYDGCTAMLNICGTVVLFSAASAIITALFGQSAALFAAPLEVTQGCIVLSPLGLPIVSALLGFGGLSVIFQVLTVVSPIISAGRLLLSRVAHAALSYLLCRLLLPLLGSTDVFSSGTAASAVPWSYSVPASCAMLIFAAVTLFYCSRRQKVFTSCTKVCYNRVSNN